MTRDGGYGWMLRDARQLLSFAHFSNHALCRWRERPPRQSRITNRFDSLLCFGESVVSAIQNWRTTINERCRDRTAVTQSMARSKSALTHWTQKPPDDFRRPCTSFSGSSARGLCRSLPAGLEQWDVDGRESHNNVASLKVCAWFFVSCAATQKIYKNYPASIVTARPPADDRPARK